MTTRTTTARTPARTAAAGVALALAVLGSTVPATAAAAAPAVPATTYSAGRLVTDVGLLARVSRTSTRTTLVLDRTVLLTGAAARAAAVARGLEPLDFFVQNDNPRLRTFVVSPAVRVYGSQVLAGRPARTPITLARLQSFVQTRPGARGPVYSLRFDRSGRVSEIAEVYLP
jgi:hypothetical protein